MGNSRGDMRPHLSPTSPGEARPVIYGIHCPFSEGVHPWRHPAVDGGATRLPLFAGPLMIDSLRRQSAFLTIILLGLGGATAVAGAPMAEQLTRAQAQDLQREARLIVDLLQNHHYAGKGFRAMDSATMINRFLSELDPRAEFLDLNDAEYLHRRFDRTLKSVYLFRGDLQPAFEIFDRFAERARTRLTWAQDRLDRGFDFTVDESLPELKEAAPFKDQASADRHWE